MLAASYWSLLAPAFEIVEKSLEDKRWSFIPVGVGFLAGGLFVYIADVILMFLVSFVQLMFFSVHVHIV